MCAPGTSAPRSCCKIGTLSARSASPTSPSTQIGAGGTQGTTRDGRPSLPSAARVAPWAGTARPGGCLGTSRGPAGDGTSAARLGIPSCRAATTTLNAARAPRGAGRGASLPPWRPHQRRSRGPQRPDRTEREGSTGPSRTLREAPSAAPDSPGPTGSPRPRVPKPLSLPALCPCPACSSHCAPKVSRGCSRLRCPRCGSPCCPFSPHRKQRSTFQPGSIPSQGEGSRAAAGGAHRARPARYTPEPRESHRAAHARGPLTCLRRASGAGQAQP